MGAGSGGFFAAKGMFKRAAGAATARAMDIDTDKILWFAPAALLALLGPLGAVAGLLLIVVVLASALWGFRSGVSQRQFRNAVAVTLGVTLAAAVATYGSGRLLLDQFVPPPTKPYAKIMLRQLNDSVVPEAVRQERVAALQAEQAAEGLRLESDTANVVAAYAAYMASLVAFAWARRYVFRRARR